jgi:hypothetical protein
MSGEPPPAEGPGLAIEWQGLMFVPAAAQFQQFIMVVNMLTGWVIPLDPLLTTTALFEQ